MSNESYCPSCGARSSGEKATCERCSAVLSLQHEAQDQQTSTTPNRLRGCPDCGHRCSVSALSCPSCGCPLENVASTVNWSTNVAHVDGRQAKRRNRVIVSSLLAMAFIGAVSAIAYIVYVRHTRETELQGEVFIVTKGAQNIKLGLVEVMAIPEERIRPFIETKLLAINLEFGKYKSLEQGNSTQLQSAQQAFDAMQVQYDLLNGKLQAARAAAEKAEEDALSLTASALYSSPQEVQAYQAALNRADALKQRAEQLATQLETLSFDLESKRTNLSVAKSAAAGQLKKVIELVSSEELFKGVPADGPKAVTNSDGQFSMKLRANRKYVIAAKAQRRVFDSTEQYYWLIWVFLDGEHPNHVMLTNNNLMGTDSSDSVFKSKELIPTGITEH